jgi:ribosome-associated protein
MSTRPSTHAGDALASFPGEVQEAVRAAGSKKAANIAVLDLRQGSAFTDFFVICSGQNARQVKAIVDAIDEGLKTAFQRRPSHIEGYDSDWILLDYFEFIIHVFTPETREFYGLERLWGRAERVELPDDQPPLR